MLANRWLTPRSLRSRLSATALAGLTTTIVLTALLFLTASSASEVVAMAQRTHERVEVNASAENAAISVSDKGPGLDFAQANRLFERFHRDETRGKGSGLGLSLVHALVQAHGGRTELTPQPGGGTVATLYFPLSVPERVAA